MLFIVQESITAKACYSSDKVHENTRVTPRMGAGTGAAPGQAPPDLPSLLLDGRICYIGMPVSLCFCMLTTTVLPCVLSGVYVCLQGACYCPSCIAAFCKQDCAWEDLSSHLWRKNFFLLQTVVVAGLSRHSRYRCHAGEEHHR